MNLMLSSLKQLEFDRQLDLIKIREFRKTSEMAILSELYDKYVFLVYGVGLKYLNDRVKAQELVRNIFEKLTVEAVKEEIKNLRGWLYVKTLQEVKNQNGEVLQTKESRLVEAAFMSSISEVHPLDDTKRISDLIKDCISNLKEQQQSCIELFYFKKKCYHDIADTLNVDVKTVVNSIKDGKKNIITCLEKRDVGK